MAKIEIIPIKAIKVISPSDSLIEVFFDSLKANNQSINESDILVIASKIIAVVQGRIVDLKKVIPSTEARKLAVQAKIPAEFAEIILKESQGRYLGVVPGAITTINQYGLLANAGADQSNAEDGKVILLPENMKENAKIFHQQILSKTGKYVGIIIADSRTMPLRLGTVGCALATYGFEPIIDERGNKDLYNKPMHITTRAIADQLATAAEIVMGETNEQTPFAIIRGFPMKKISEDKEIDINRLITMEKCMFLGPIVDCIKEKGEIK